MIKIRNEKIGWNNLIVVYVIKEIESIIKSFPTMKTSELDGYTSDPRRYQVFIEEIKKKWRDNTNHTNSEETEKEGKHLIFLWSQ